MAINGAGQFEKFGWQEFCGDKVLMVKNVAPMRNYDTGEITGTKVEALIIKDDTQYKPKADGSVVSNLFNALSVKLPKQDVNVKIGDIVEFKNVTAKVWGDFRNELSVTAEDVTVVGQAGNIFETKSSGSGK